MDIQDIKKHWGKSLATLFFVGSTPFWSDLSNAIEQVNEVLNAGESLKVVKEEQVQMKQSQQQYQQQQQHQINSIQTEQRVMQEQIQQQVDTSARTENKIDKLNDMFTQFLMMQQNNN